jgi:hypothetical protein
MTTVDSSAVAKSREVGKSERLLPVLEVAESASEKELVGLVHRCTRDLQFSLSRAHIRRIRRTKGVPTFHAVRFITGELAVGREGYSIEQSEAE